MMDKGVKQRLLGGVVLVAGAVLFLPYVFSGSGNGLPPRPEIPPKPAVTAADDMAPQLDKQEAAQGQAISDAHSAPDAAPPVLVQPTVASAAPAPVVASAPPPVAQVIPPAASAPAQAKPATQKPPKPKADVVAVAPEAAPAVAPAPKKPAADAAGAGEAWVVQVASLSTQDKANDLVSRLHKKGYHAATHASGEYWKVTVGPELSKDMAESLRQKLAADPAFKLSGWVQSYHP